MKRLRFIKWRKKVRSGSYAQKKDGSIKEKKMIREEVAIEDTF